MDPTPRAFASFLDTGTPCHSDGRADGRANGRAKGRANGRANGRAQAARLDGFGRADQHDTARAVKRHGMMFGTMGLSRRPVDGVSLKPQY